MRGVKIVDNLFARNFHAFKSCVSHCLRNPLPPASCSGKEWIKWRKFMCFLFNEFTIMYVQYVHVWNAHMHLHKTFEYKILLFSIFLIIFPYTYSAIISYCNGIKALCKWYKLFKWVHMCKFSMCMNVQMYPCVRVCVYDMDDLL